MPLFVIYKGPGGYFWVPPPLPLRVQSRTSQLPGKRREKGERDVVASSELDERREG